MVGAGCGSAATKSSDARGGTADPSAVSVIRAWSTALRHGDVAAAARYFALPSEFANGPDEVLTIHTEAQARAVNTTLPCGALLISVQRRGQYLSALFRLTNRSGPEAGCGSGAGQLARTDFVIANGHIVEWVRADTTGGGQPPAAPAPTTIPSGGGPAV